VSASDSQLADSLSCGKFTAATRRPAASLKPWFWPSWKFAGTTKKFPTFSIDACMAVAVAAGRSFDFCSFP